MRSGKKSRQRAGLVTGAFCCQQAVAAAAAIVSKINRSLAGALLPHIAPQTALSPGSRPDITGHDDGRSLAPLQRPNPFQRAVPQSRPRCGAVFQITAARRDSNPLHPFLDAALETHGDYRKLNRSAGRALLRLPCTLGLHQIAPWCWLWASADITDDACLLSTPPPTELVFKEPPQFRSRCGAESLTPYAPCKAPGQPDSQKVNPRAPSVKGLERADFTKLHDSVGGGTWSELPLSHLKERARPCSRDLEA